MVVCCERGGFEYDVIVIWAMNEDCCTFENVKYGTPKTQNREKCARITHAHLH